MAKKQDEAAWFREHFPTQHARDVADQAIDKLALSEPMSAYIDAWIAAYKQAGGKTRIPG